MHRFINLIALWTIAVAGCSGHFLPKPPAPSAIENQRFVIAPVGPQDTLPALARTYLGDEGKAWQIAAYNGSDILTPGRQVIIPRVPLIYGGIDQKGYQTVPVLLYPKLTSSPSKSKAKSKAMDAKTFDRQLQYLKDNGFTTISLDQLYAFLSLKEQLPPKAVAITFDTTHRWVYEIAFPYLKRRQMKAALFIRPKRINTKGMLSWAQIAEMAANGWDIGVQGVSLKPSDDDNLKQMFDAFERVFTAPQKAFGTHLKQPCTFFVYPEGKSNDLAIAMLKKHGYRMAFTRKRGSNPFFIDDYKIKRATIQGPYDEKQFRRSLKTYTSAELK